MSARKESSSCVSRCVGYNMGYIAILWDIEKSEKEFFKILSFLLLPPVGVYFLH